MEANNTPTPLHSAEAEKQVVSMTLTNPSLFDVILEFITPSDFYFENYRDLFSTLLSLHNQQKTIDIFSVFEYYKKLENNHYWADIKLLSDIVISSYPAEHITEFCKVIKKYSAMRKMYALLNNAMVDITNAPKDIEFNLTNFIDNLENKIFQLRNTNFGNKDFVHITEATNDAFIDIGNLQQRQKNGEVAKLETGFLDLDKKIQGLQGGDLIIVAGRPSMGKTAFAVNIVENIAAKNKTKKFGVGIFSLEMTVKQLALRMFSSLASIRNKNLCIGEISPDEMDRIEPVFETLKQSYIYIDDSGYTTPTSIRAKTKRLAQTIKHQSNNEVKLDLLVIDYLQLIASDKSTFGKTSYVDKKELIPEITRQLKLLAKELDIPIILLSQLNRENEKRTDKRPMLSDLRDSGAIEQDADLVIMMYRPEYYNKTPENQGKAEAIITKYRNGETGTVNLVYEGDYTRFVNMAEYSSTPNDYGEFF